MMGAVLTPPVLVCPSSVPTIGPVHEKDTITKVSAIKKIPPNPPLPAFDRLYWPSYWAIAIQMRQKRNGKNQDNCKEQ
jgi:hypothetical protein